LPAPDLSPIGKACGGQIDDIRGVDLLDRMDVTIDLKRKVAGLKLGPSDTPGRFAELEGATHHGSVAFKPAKASEPEDCLDPDIVLYPPDGEYQGRKQVMQYMNQTHFKFALEPRFEMTPHDVRSFGSEHAQLARPARGRNETLGQVDGFPAG
jgi:hypothetical protein